MFFEWRYSKTRATWAPYCLNLRWRYTLHGHWAGCQHSSDRWKVLHQRQIPRRNRDTWCLGRILPYWPSVSDSPYDEWVVDHAQYLIFIHDMVDLLRFDDVRFLKHLEGIKLATKLVFCQFDSSERPSAQGVEHIVVSQLHLLRNGLLHLNTKNNISRLAMNSPRLPKTVQLKMSVLAC